MQPKKAPEQAGASAAAPAVWRAFCKASHEHCLMRLAVISYTHVLYRLPALKQLQPRQVSQLLPRKSTAASFPPCSSPAIVKACYYSYVPLQQLHLMLYRAAAPTASAPAAAASAPSTASAAPSAAAAAPAAAASSGDPYSSAASNLATGDSLKQSIDGVSHGCKCCRSFFIYVLASVISTKALSCTTSEPTACRLSTWVSHETQSLEQ